MEQSEIRYDASTGWSSQGEREVYEVRQALINWVSVTLSPSLSSVFDIICFEEVESIEDSLSSNREIPFMSRTPLVWIIANFELCEPSFTIHLRKVISNLKFLEFMELKNIKVVTYPNASKTSFRSNSSSDSTFSSISFPPTDQPLV
jgi:hypothetical protein